MGVPSFLRTTTDTPYFEIGAGSTWIGAERRLMRQLLLLGTWTFIGALLIVSGVSLVLPGRNLYGDQRLERETASCVLPDDAEVKLYQGDSTAKTPAWYSVTHNPAGASRERQIVYRSRSPGLYDLICDSTGVVIRTDSEPITLTAEQASRLRDWPRSAPTWPLMRWAVGGALVLLGAALLWYLRPKGED